MKRKHHESGQAFAEFVISLIAILFIFVGVLSVSVITMENVSCLIRTRSEAGVASSLGTAVGGVSPQTILEWDYGKDNIPFTADDKSISGADSEIMAQKFNTAEDSLPNSGLLTMSLADFAKQGYADGRAGETPFLAAANLNGFTNTVTDPLSKRGLPEIQRLFRRIIGGEKFVLEDTVFIPAKVD